MKKALLIAGAPGTGKTTIMKKVMEMYDGWEQNELAPLVQAMVADKAPTVIGIYGGDEVFQGTDRLSMAVQPEFRKWVESSDVDILLEGDRLVSSSNIDFLIEKGYTVKVIVLDVSMDTRNKRYEERGSNQDPTWLASKETKVSKIASRMDMLMDGSLEILPHETPADTELLAQAIYNFFV
ncbi:MAG: P-loop-containing protein [Cyclobacteriaceae bacterium]